MNGYIKLHRKMLTWGWYSDANTMRVFMDILLNANYTDGEYRGYPIKAGQCVIGRKKLAQRLGISEQSVRTALQHLISTNEITITSTNKFSVVTIEKWAEYQFDEPQSTNKATSKSTNHQPTTNHIQERKKERNIRNIIPPKAEWVKDYCAERKNNVDPDTFMDFYSSKNWMIGKSKMKDWQASIRTWEKNRSGKDDKPKTIEPPKYEMFKPDPKVDAVQMPDEIRERLGKLF